MPAAYSDIDGTSRPADPPAGEPPLKPSAVERVHAVARGAHNVAADATHSVKQFLQAPMPQLSLYTEPFDPSASHSMRQRLQLVGDNCRRWGEFADLSTFNTPPASEAKRRVAHNLETFFYNYVLVAFVLLVLCGLFHPIRALALAVMVLTAVLLYIVFPEDYPIGDRFSITKPIKHVFMTLFALLVLTVGHVFNFLFLVLCITLPIVLLHAFFREHDASTALDNTHI
ncbi:unnamed protein product [Agarophyton chilense]